MGTISEFVETFRRDKEFFARIEKEVETLCKEKLLDHNIKFSWQSRVKEADSLRVKLEDRGDLYANETDNVADIKDLVAGRIIVTRWKDFGLVEEMIKKNFDIQGRSQHPKAEENLVTLSARFRGYDGLHFHVTRRNSRDERYGDLLIEIQVMSAFMWAFSTPEHDHVYKKLKGEPDRTLLSNLEMLKGIANLGEVAYQQYDELLCADSSSPCFELHDASPDQKIRIREFVREKKDIVSEEVQSQERIKKIISWVSKVDIEDDHNLVRRTLGSLYTGSGQWLRPRFDEWLASSEKQVFWLAGSGL